jgi:hypothetical protein
MNFGYLTTFQSLDKGLIERIGPTGFTVSTFSLSSNYTIINSGVLYHTTLMLIVFSVVFLVFFALSSFGLLSSFSISFLFLFISYILALFSEI